MIMNSISILIIPHIKPILSTSYEVMECSSVLLQNNKKKKKLYLHNIDDNLSMISSTSIIYSFITFTVK